MEREWNGNEKRNGGGKGKQRMVAVIGAGAAGCMAALAAAEAGAQVLLFDRNEKIGKKIYATGNGRCNLTNSRMEPDCYYQSRIVREMAGGLADRRGAEKDGRSRAVSTDSAAGEIRRGGSPERDSASDWGGAQALRRMEGFSNRELLAFLEKRGIYCHERDGYWYPRTDQAATIAAFFERELRAAGVRLFLNTEVRNIRSEASGRELRTDAGKLTGKEATAGGQAIAGQETGNFHIEGKDGGAYHADAVVLACGGMVSREFGCLGDGYRFAESFGHRIIPPAPALTALRCADPLLKRAAGVRCEAAATLCIGEVPVRTERGEVQMAEYGLSGIPVFQLSRLAAQMLWQEETGQKMPVPEQRTARTGQIVRAGCETARSEAECLTVRLDFLPELTEVQWEAEKGRRLARRERNETLDTIFLGLVNRKLLDYLLAGRGLCAENKSGKLSREKLEAVLDDMRAKSVPVTGVNPFDKAQTTAGGVSLTETDDGFQSRRQPGLYLVGELLDVDGICGGYNLQWAFAGGYLAGTAAGRVL